MVATKKVSTRKPNKKMKSKARSAARAKVIVPKAPDKPSDAGPVPDIQKLTLEVIKRANDVIFHGMSNHLGGNHKGIRSTSEVAMELILAMSKCKTQREKGLSLANWAASHDLGDINGPPLVLVPNPKEDTYDYDYDDPVDYRDL